MAEETKPPEGEGGAPPAEDAPADDPPPQATAEEPEPEAPDAQDTPGEDAPITAEEARSWVGFKLDEMGGQSIGKVEGLYVDDQSGRLEWLLARMGRFGHHCLVPAREAVAAGGRVWVPYSRDQIRSAPRIEPNRALERDREQGLLEHYGVGTGAAGRGAELAERATADVTARPV